MAQHLGNMWQRTLSSEDTGSLVYSVLRDQHNQLLPAQAALQKLEWDVAEQVELFDLASLLIDTHGMFCNR